MARPRPAASYRDCLRKCERCGVAYSNGRSRPTLIYEDPLDNLPTALRSGALDVLERSMNVDNRSNKRAKFGFIRSEDAVTWTIFVGLLRSIPFALPAICRELFDLSIEQAPELLLWGASVEGSKRGQAVEERLIDISDRLGERARSRSEPDVILDFGPAGLVVIEVKYQSPNDHRERANWTPYLNESRAFAQPTLAQSSGLYELVRNWRIAHDLAASSPFLLVNLAPQHLLDATPGRPLFERSLGARGNGRFLPLSWSDFLAVVEGQETQLPPWWDPYVESRSLRS